MRSDWRSWCEDEYEKLQTNQVTDVTFGTCDKNGKTLALTIEKQNVLNREEHLVHYSIMVALSVKCSLEEDNSLKTHKLPKVF